MFDECVEEKVPEKNDKNENAETKPVSNRRSRRELENGALLASQLAKNVHVRSSRSFRLLFTPLPSLF